MAAHKSPQAKKNSPLLPANDPNRPCWHIFSDFFGESIAPPQDEGKACAMLRDLLQRAYAQDPYKLVRIAYMGDRWSRGRIEAFAAALHATGSDLERRWVPPDSRDGETKTLLRASTKMSTALAYIVSNLWSMGQGATKARSKVYIDLGTNTNEPIRSYLPQAAGVVPYLRARLAHILQDYYETQRKLPRTVSLDRLKESSLELTDRHEFVRDLQADPEAPPGAEMADDAPLTEVTEAVAERELADILAEVPDGDTPLGEIPPDNDELTAQIAAVRDAAPGERSEAYNDWPLRVFIPGYKPDQATDVAYVRPLVINLLEMLQRVDPEIHADFDTLVSILGEWDGTTPLVVALPELDDAAFRHRHELAEAAVSASSPKVSQFELFGAEQINRLLIPTQEPSPNPLAPRLAAMQTELTLDELLSAHPTDQELKSAERIDYIFLTAQAGEPFNHRLEGNDLYTELKRLAEEFCITLRARGGDAERLGQMLHGWNPAKELISGPLQRAALELARRANMDVESQSPASPPPDFARQPVAQSPVSPPKNAELSFD